MVLRTDPGALAVIGLVLPYPAAQGLRGAAHLGGYGHDRFPLRLVIRTLLQHQLDCPLPYFGGVPRRFRHALNLPQRGVSGKPGAIHTLVGFAMR